MNGKIDKHVKTRGQSNRNNEPVEPSVQWRIYKKNKKNTNQNTPKDENERTNERTQLLRESGDVDAVGFDLRRVARSAALLCALRRRLASRHEMLSKTTTTTPDSNRSQRATVADDEMPSAAATFPVTSA